MRIVIAPLLWCSFHTHTLTQTSNPLFTVQLYLRLFSLQCCCILFVLFPLLIILLSNSTYMLSICAISARFYACAAASDSFSLLCALCLRSCAIDRAKQGISHFRLLLPSFLLLNSKQSVQLVVCALASD